VNAAPVRIPVCAALTCFALALPPLCGAASFDCGRARSKLNRIICSDATLSQLDEAVWNAYGERVGGLTALQLAHVRERHLLWRRSRGLYESTVEALIHEYRSHLAWLLHPGFPYEGRYERVGPGSLPGDIEVEIDLRQGAGLALQGRTPLPVPMSWRAGVPAVTGAGPDQGTGALTVKMRPGAGTANDTLVPACLFTIRFSGDDLTLDSEGECGGAFAGTYTRVPLQP
jgi:hypothetical protein